MRFESEGYRSVLRQRTDCHGVTQSPLTGNGYDLDIMEKKWSSRGVFEMKERLAIMHIRSDSLNES
jgi:hypothetical protein